MHSRFTLRSCLRYLRVLHALAVHTHSTNSIQLSFTVRSLTMRSAFAQRSFSVRFTFTLRLCLNIERFRDCIIIFRQSNLQLFILSLQIFNLIIYWLLKLNRICNGIHNGLYWFTTNGRYSFIYLLYISSRSVQNWLSCGVFLKDI